MAYELLRPRLLASVRTVWALDRSSLRAASSGAADAMHGVPSMNGMGGRLLTEQEIRDFRAAWPKGGAMRTIMEHREEIGRLKAVNAELLAALKGMLEWSDATVRGANPFKDDVLKAKISNARAAIRKALGA